MERKVLENKIFLDRSIEYLILNDDYYYFVELGFIDDSMKGPHDESKCFINHIKDVSEFDYSPYKFRGKLIE